MDIKKLVEDEQEIRLSEVEKTEELFNKKFDKKAFLKDGKAYMAKYFKKEFGPQVQDAFQQSVISGAKNAKD